jgi:hypothetical protein
MQTKKPDLSAYEYMDPDALYKGGSTTFVYHIKTGKLYAEDYPTTHEDIMNRNNHEVAREMGWAPDPNKPTQGHYYDTNNYLSRDNALKIAILGRVGSYKNNQCIGFWNPKVKKSVIKNCLTKVVNDLSYLKEHPEKVIVFFDYSESTIKPRPLNRILSDDDLEGPTTARPDDQQDPECDRLGTLTVDGKPMKLSTMLGNLHMVRDGRLDGMKGAFCPAATDLKKTMAHCKGAPEVIDTLWRKLGCASGQSNQYNQLKQLGAAAYRRDLRKVFDNPDSIDKEFRGRQKDIDAAWDYLQKKEHSFRGFKTWLEST